MKTFTKKSKIKIRFCTALIAAIIFSVLLVASSLVEIDAYYMNILGVGFVIFLIALILFNVVCEIILE